MSLRHELSRGDMRTTGQSEKIVARMLRHPQHFDELMRLILDDDPRVRMRAADAAEKISAQRPEYLFPYKKFILKNIAPIPQQEVRWHVCQMIPRLRLNNHERVAAVSVLKSYLQDKSAIVRTFAMQALYDLSIDDRVLRAPTLALIAHLAKTGTPAMRSRGKKLLALAEKQKSEAH